MPRLGRRGFTLLEAVVAMAVLGLAGVAALEALGGELRVTERARSATTAAALAQNRLAVLTLLPRSALDPLTGSLARGAFQTPFTDYRWTTTVRPVLGEKDLYDVMVEVTSDAGHISVATRLFRPVRVGVLQ